MKDAEKSGYHKIFTVVVFIIPALGAAGAGF